MTPAFTARRRAEEFDALVEARSTGALRDADHAHSRDPRYADLLDVVGTLRAVTPPDPRPEFVADLRSRLMTAAETALVAPATPAPARTPERSRRRERRLAAAIGGFAIVSASTSMAVAAQSALPGDTLYPLKRGIENAQVRVQSGDEDKGSALLENAADRLAEVDELSRDGEGRAADITATLDDFSTQATEASELLLDDYDKSGRVSSLEDLRSFAADSIADLEALEAVVPADAREALLDAARTIARIDELAREACPACTDGPAAISPLLTAAVVPGDELPGLEEPAAPARTERERGRSGQGLGGPAAPDPTPPGDSGSTAPSPPAPSLPAGGAPDQPQPPATGAGAENPLGGIIDGLTGRGGGTTTSGGGTGTGGRTGGGGGTGGGGTGADRTTGGGGLQDVVEGLGDLLDGGR